MLHSTMYIVIHSWQTCGSWDVFAVFFFFGLLQSQSPRSSCLRQAKKGRAGGQPRQAMTARRSAPNYPWLPSSTHLGRSVFPTDDLAALSASQESVFQRMRKEYWTECSAKEIKKNQNPKPGETRRRRGSQMERLVRPRSLFDLGKPGPPSRAKPSTARTSAGVLCECVYLSILSK